jgi:hypothetical protein
LCSIAALLSTDTTLLAQAGSIGGTLGKTDKSASGGEEPQGDKKAAEGGVATKHAVTIAGKWIWHGKCADDSEWAGTFDLDQRSDGTVSGTCSITRQSAIL